MGVSSSLYSGVSGLNANANAMSVIGNNIANANTVGFKSSRAIFGDLLSSQISGSGGASQVGRGVGLSIVDNIFSQGTFENTETNTDLAIEGSGFFIVSDPTTGNAGNFYTRAGAFRFDAGGFLVNPEGFNVMGYDLDANGNTVGDLQPIWVNTNSFTQSGPTGNVNLNTNLNSDATAIPGGFDISDPSVTSNYATSIQVFDSLGSTHLMTTYFTKTADQTWDWNAVVDGGELEAGAVDSDGNAIVGAGIPGEFAIVGSGTLGFDPSGNLIVIDEQPLYSNITEDPPGSGTFVYPLDSSAYGDPVEPKPKATIPGGNLPWGNGALPTQEIAIDMQTTQYASPSVVVSQEQDGFGTGTLVKLSIDAEGYIVGNFSNGAPRKLMQMALAKFTNPNALDKIGNNMYSQSTSSGVPVVGTVGSGVGNIFTNALELSNVDLASEFVKMITTQRGFSANSKTITTTDEMLAEVINLKR
ncbi:flagellar hook protein FlgE [Pelovirga terrestris]|uniref:Flagellar hook protein FlgE n=1 Tax=Pelovirga terrestris TaxID=2771352 RepID=A0A8J6QQS2_9BACT|nr:flagellar hook protein FlgE [Pelovirga terrestris]MBD1400433.1 flagellar hook protein FlgE [Pelovirga terrestris]